MEIVAQPNVKSKRKVNLKGMFTRRRKLMILSAMFALLVVTGYLNFTLNNRTPEVGGGGGTAGTQHLFVMFRQTRAAERESQMRILENIALATSGYSEQARQQAEQRKLELIAEMQFESAAEGMIVAAGFRDAVVQKNGGNVNVLIRHNENITDVQAAQIKTILDHIANRTIDIDNIFISVVE